MSLSNRLCPTLRLIPAAALILAACDRPRDADLFTVHDSAGIVIAENIAPSWDADAAWQIVAEPHVVIGADAARSGHDLYDVTGVVRIDGQRIAIANSGSSEVRIFSNDGDLVATLGRPGEGPGEFRAMSRLFVIPGDSLLVTDNSLDRLTAFPLDGGAPRTAQIEMPDSGGLPYVTARLSNGTLVARPAFTFTGGAPTGIYVDTMTLMRYDAAGGHRGTIARVTGSENMVYSENGNTFGGERMWGRRTLVATAGEQIVIGTAQSYEWELRNADGRTVRIVRASRPRRPVTDADLAELRKTSESEDAASSEFFNRLLRAIEPPSHFPAYSGIFAAEEGHVWVRDYVYPDDGRPAVWQVFDPDGRWLGGVTLPAGFEPRSIIGSEVLGIYRDDMDVEQVHAYRIIRPGA